MVDNYILLVTTKGLIRSESMDDVAKGFNKTKVHFVVERHEVQF